MSNETIIKTGTPKTIEANGASITNNSIVQADDATYGIFVDGGSYPDAKFVLAATFSVAPAEGTTISLYAQSLDIDGTNDTDVPEATRPTVFVGVFIVNNVTTTQYLELIANDVPWLASYYLHNNGTGQTISAGWTLKVTPATRAPAP